MLNVVQTLIKTLDFRRYLLTYAAEKVRKWRPFNLRNNADTLLKHLQIKLEKVREYDFFDRQNELKTTTKMLKVSQNLFENIDFRGQISTFKAENTPRSRSLEASTI